MYQRKTQDEYQIHVNYGYGDGWEHEISEPTYQLAKQRKREYNDNCHYPVKIVCKRVPLEADNV